MSDIFGEEDVELPQDEPAAEAPQTAEAEPAEPEPEKPAEAVKPTVPIDALHAARREAQELRAKLGNLESQVQQFATLKEQLDQYRQQATQQTQEEKFTQDPLGALRDDIQALKQTQEETKQSQEQRAQTEEQQRQLQEAVQAQVSSFSAEHEDYPQALEHVLSTRAEELRIFGATEAQIQQQLNQESVMLAQQAIAAGANPAEWVYNLARVKGYAQAPQKKSATVESIQKGQQAAKSLADTQGSEAAAEIGLADIERMSDEEFDEYWKKEVEPSRA